MNVVRLSVLPTGRLYLQEIFLVHTAGWVEPRAIEQQGGLYQRKIPMTPSGIEPATFRLVALCLNQLRHRLTCIGCSKLIERLPYRPREKMNDILSWLCLSHEMFHIGAPQYHQLALTREETCLCVKYSVIRSAFLAFRLLQQAGRARLFQSCSWCGDS